MPQLAYNSALVRGYPGMKADSGFDRVESFAAEENVAAAGLNFGRFVVAGTDAARQVRQANNAAGVLRGISIHQHTETGVYKDGETVSVARKGVILMQAATIIPIDTVVYAVVAAGADQGKPTATAAANLATGAVARSAAVAIGDIIEVEINLP